MQRISFLIVLVAFIAGSAIAQIYNVTDYGAQGNGIYENAQSIQNAIDAAADVGGGVVLFPPGEYRTATIFLKDNVT